MDLDFLCFPYYRTTAWLCLNISQYIKNILNLNLTLTNCEGKKIVNKSIAAMISYIYS